ncbi:hypothetical protein [Roseomonas elaeocarpi]|uniref:Uncharacterized protein n=1 Tax=Roseomonas elaeocarpi TaxID=907779 RepID=A0ABV6JPI0_9PROT
MRDFPIHWFVVVAIVAWIAIELLTRVRGKSKLKLRENARTGKIEAEGHGKAPFDDIEPQGDLLADHLDIPAVLHHARPSGAIEVKSARIQRIYGRKDFDGLQIGTVMSAPEAEGKPRGTYQFYRLRSIEDPESGALLVSDLDKARWLAAKGKLI